MPSKASRVEDSGNLSAGRLDGGVRPERINNQPVRLLRFHAFTCSRFAGLFHLWRGFRYCSKVMPLRLIDSKTIKKSSAAGGFQIGLAATTAVMHRVP